MFKLLCAAALCLSTLSTDWKTYSKDNYSISHPADWEIREKLATNTLFSCLSPMESDTDLFRENIGLVTEDLSSAPEMTLKEYAELSEKVIRKFINDYKPFEDTLISTKNGDYHKLRYSGAQGVYKLMFEQRFRIVNKKAYILTFVSELDKYEAFRDNAGKIMDTFELK